MFNFTFYSIPINGSLWSIKTKKLWLIFILVWPDFIGYAKAVYYPPKKVNSMCTHTSKIIFRIFVFILYLF